MSSESHGEPCAHDLLEKTDVMWKMNYQQEVPDTWLRVEMWAIAGAYYCASVSSLRRTSSKLIAPSQWHLAVSNFKVLKRSKKYHISMCLSSRKSNNQKTDENVQFVWQSRLNVVDLARIGGVLPHAASCPDIVSKFWREMSSWLSGSGFAMISNGSSAKKSKVCFIFQGNYGGNWSISPLVY